MMSERRTRTAGHARTTPRPRARQAQGEASPRRSSAAARTAAREHARQAERGAAGSTQPSASAAPQPAKRYITSLDGLRAFAVLAVILYHLNVPFAQGGLLGVTVFFVISGYLITGLLTAEWDESGTIRLLKFWMRRIRRLFPAIVTVIVVMAALFALLSPVLLTKMRPDIVPGLFWFTNWWYILRDVSYFEALGAPSPLTHFWSLAIEEQFYLVWPVILLGVYKVGVGKKGARRACLVLAVVSAIAMAVLYDPHGDPSRVYYGTDTRAFSLLIGAWLSFVWPGAQLTEENTGNVSPSAVRALDAAGLAAFAGIVVMCTFVSGLSGFMYRGGLVLCSVLSAVVIAALSHPRSRLARIAEFKPFVWIGQRSYGMYLWHFPIILLLAELLGLHGPDPYPWWFDVLAIVLVGIVSALSYTFIENPIRKGAIGNRVRGVRSGEVPVVGFLRAHAVQTGAIAVVLAVAIGGCAMVPATYIVTEDTLQNTGSSVDHAMDLVADARRSTLYCPLLIGDSVPTSGSDEFEVAFPHGLRDCVVGRWPGQAAEVLADYVNQGVVGDVVVVAAFSNGLLADGDLDAMLEAVGPDRELYLMNTYNTEGFMDAQNDLIDQFAAAHENVHVIDWASFIAPHAESWLYSDGVHPYEGVRQILVGFIQDAIASDLQPDQVGPIRSEFALPDDYAGEVDLN